MVARRKEERGEKYREKHKEREFEEGGIGRGGNHDDEEDETQEEGKHVDTVASPKEAANAASGSASACVVAAASPGSMQRKLDVALERRRAAHRRIGEEEGRGGRGRQGFLGLVASLGQEGGCSVRNVKEGAVLQARWVEKKGVIRGRRTTRT